MELLRNPDESLMSASERKEHRRKVRQFDSDLEEKLKTRFPSDNEFQRIWDRDVQQEYREGSHRAKMKKRLEASAAVREEQLEAKREDEKRKKEMDNDPDIQMIRENLAGWGGAIDDDEVFVLKSMQVYAERGMKEAYWQAAVTLGESRVERNQDAANVTQAVSNDADVANAKSQMMLAEIQEKTCVAKEKTDGNT